MSIAIMRCTYGRAEGAESVNLRQSARGGLERSAGWAVEQQEGPIEVAVSGTDDTSTIQLFGKGAKLSK